MNPRVLVAASVVLLALPVGNAPALATTPGQHQYQHILAQEAALPSHSTTATTGGKVAAAGQTEPAPKFAATLPFTGLDAALVVAGGAAAAAAGLGLRRLGRRGQS